MLITTVNPVGIDAAITNLQNQIYTRLKNKWGIDDSFYDCYGRVYRNKKDNQYIAEVYTGGEDGKDYREVYWDDKKAAISWFGTGSIIDFNIKNKASVHLVFFVNLKRIKPDALTRADEEARRDVQAIFGNSLQGFTFESVELWTENVLREYPGSRRDNRLSVVDMHPLHCFRINLTALYSSNICVL